jgi:hypothetical protein
MSLSTVLALFCAPPMATTFYDKSRALTASTLYVYNAEGWKEKFIILCAGN